MPTVPRSTTTTVTPTGLPDVAAPKLTARDFGGAQAEAAIVAGQALFGGAEILQKVQDRRDLSKVLDAESALIKGMNERQPKYLLDKKEKAEDVTDRAKEDWEKAYSEVSAGMSDKQLQLLKKRMQRVLLRHYGVISNHEVAEGYNAEVSANEATQTAATDFAAINATNGLIVSEQRNEIVRLSMAHPDNEGVSEAESEVREKQALLKFHTQVFQSLARSDPGMVDAYYKEYREDIPGSSRDDIEELVFQASSTAKAQAAGDEAISKFDSVDAALTAMRKKTKKGKQRAVSAAEIKGRFREKDNQHAREQNDILEKVKLVLSKDGRRSAIPPDLYARADGTTRGMIDSIVENPNGPARTSWDRYEELIELRATNNIAFLGVKIGMEPNITERYRNELLEMQLKDRTGKSSKNHLKNESLGAMLRIVHQQLDLGTSSADNKIRGDLREYVGRAQDYAEQIRNQDLTSSELRAEIYKAIASGVVVRTGFWPWGVDKYALQLDEQEIIALEIDDDLQQKIVTKYYESKGYVRVKEKYINPNTNAPAPALTEKFTATLLNDYKRSLIRRRRDLYGR